VCGRDDLLLECAVRSRRYVLWRSLLQPAEWSRALRLLRQRLSRDQSRCLHEWRVHVRWCAGLLAEHDLLRQSLCRHRNRYGELRRLR